MPVGIDRIIKGRIQRVEAVLREAKNSKAFLNCGKYMFFGRIFSIAEK